MPESSFLPEFAPDWEATRATLHAYAHGVGAIARAYAETHPKWWHVSLTLADDALVSDAVPLPGGGTLQVHMDFAAHEVVVDTSGGDRHSVSMAARLTGTELADRLITIAGGYGLDSKYDRGKFENDDAREYDPAAATTFFRTLSAIAGVFESHRAGLPGEVSPVQVWPHGFDIAFEWYGSRVEMHEENGEISEHPSQLNLGFYPAGRAYFYSNPWPFESDVLLDQPLPHGAQWHTDGWEGSILYYDQLQDDPDAEKKLLEYAAAVFAVVSPTLTA